MNYKYDGDILKLLGHFIDDARMSLTDLPEDTVLAQKKLINFQNEIVQFLDYVYTNFPTNENKNKHAYFPRPKYLEDKISFMSDYKSNKSNANSSPELLAFLDKCYDFTAKHGFAISLIEPSAKHERPHTVSQSTSIEHKSRDPRAQEIITYLEDGSIDIGPGIIRIGPNSRNIKLMNFNINGIQIDDLTIFRVGNGQIVTFYLPKNQGNIDIKYIEWAKNCVLSCEDIYSMISP